jgi:site-specific recombinase XerD
MKINMKLFRRKNGYYYVRYYRGKENSLETKDKDIAKELFRGLEADYLKGKLLHLQNYKTITLGEFRKDYVKNYRTGLSKYTTLHDEMSLKLLAEVIGDNTQLSTIATKTAKKSKIEEFKTALLARNVKPVSINSYLRHIKKALNNALESEIIDKIVKIKMVPVGKKLPRILYPEQIDMLLVKAKEKDIYEWLYYMLLLWTGARRAEADGADWCRINLKHDHIKFIGKGNHERMVTLLPPIKAALEPFKKDIGPVFPEQHLDTYTHHFKKLARSCGIEDVHLHNLRHTAATYMLKSGIDIKVVQRILGHASVTTTEIYTDVLDEMIKNEMTKFEYK